LGRNPPGAIFLFLDELWFEKYRIKALQNNTIITIIYADVNIYIVRDD
jgi:hypothetical protein